MRSACSDELSDGKKLPPISSVLSSLNPSHMDSSLPSPKGYKVPDAAKALNVSRRFLEQEIKRGRLPIMRFSARCVRIRPQDLDSYAEKYVVGGAAK
jgi:excisionase family DNA binding protein